MAAVEPSAATTGDAPISYSPAAPYSARLREALTALSEACDSGNSNAAETASFTISDILDTAAIVSAEVDDGSEDASRPGASEELLREVLEFLSRPSSISNQMALDALSLVLPKPVAKLGAQMGRCRDVAAAILKFFVSNCSPRDMLSILCEALDAPMELPNGLSSFVLLLDALAKVLTLIQRRYIEQVKVALPVVLKVMHTAVSECVEEHGSAAVDLFNAAHNIGNAIQEMCKSMLDKNKDLCAILGLYSLQNIALVSQSRQQDILSACGSVIFQSFNFLISSGFTYLGLLTGSDVTAAIDKLSKSDAEEDADFVEYFSFAMDGAALSVVWTHMYDDNDMSKYAGEQLELALKEVQGNHMKKWEAITMLKHVLSSIHYPWIIKSHGLNLMLILAGENHVEEINNHVDFTCYAPRIFATLKAIESVMMAAPAALVRKKAFVALKKVISMVPSSQRFDILQALVNNSTSPSLTAILLDLVREEVSRESRRADNDCVEDDGFRGSGLPRWASHALELVELILRPPEGGPPCLPDHSEQEKDLENCFRKRHCTRCTWSG
ncbi:aberrant root formation protein 4 isoform X2 [Sorghum bicolor]|uniref:aberrant root formation protein 4 isoform X2 n=1 Tax=Sorghum bicolor TaxID=4558 RepID=UPI000B424CFF|nr:aberrant root formation protein 4 isoform X2 [Sorghum bicolor]|eukprot:XP_021304380.1 aberrant root formation protein 4 isoform X2 [Sorghum bicolor]